MSDLEQAILEAAEKNDDHLEALLLEAIETLDEQSADHLLDKVHQIMSEAVRDIRGWKDAESEVEAL